MIGALELEVALQQQPLIVRGAHRSSGLLTDRSTTDGIADQRSTPGR